MAAADTGLAARRGNSVFQHSRPKAAGRGDYRLVTRRAIFNTQPPEGGWGRRPSGDACAVYVSTHSRPKAAGAHAGVAAFRPGVSTHSRPKAADNCIVDNGGRHSMFQHAAARRRLSTLRPSARAAYRFQHAAARRRLRVSDAIRGHYGNVSTRSRPKAAD